MNPDPIVEEIRVVRERILAQFDGDLSKYVEALINAQGEHGSQLVTKEELVRKKQEAAVKRI
jgi:hypothetical protein